MSFTHKAKNGTSILNKKRIKERPNPYIKSLFLEIISRLN